MSGIVQGKPPGCQCMWEMSGELQEHCNDENWVEICIWEFKHAMNPVLWGESCTGWFAFMSHSVDSAKMERNETILTSAAGSFACSTM